MLSDAITYDDLAKYVMAIINDLLIQSHSERCEYFLPFIAEKVVKIGCFINGEVYSDN